MTGLRPEDFEPKTLVLLVDAVESLSERVDVLRQAVDDVDEGFDCGVCSAGLGVLPSIDELVTETIHDGPSSSVVGISEGSGAAGFSIPAAPTGERHLHLVDSPPQPPASTPSGPETAQAVVEAGSPFTVADAIELAALLADDLDARLDALIADGAR